MSPNRVRAFTGPRAKEDAEKCGHWLKALPGVGKSKEWCIEHHVALTKASNESGNTAGGFLVPTELDAAIIAVRDTVGAFRQAEVRSARTVNQLRPRRTGGLTANFVSEGGSIPESQLQFDAVEPSLKKMAILARASSELFEDSAPDLAEFIATEAGYAFAALEDDCGFNGDGTSTYSGISGLGTKLAGLKSAVTATGGNTFITISAADLGAVMGAVISAAVPGARWYVSQVAYANTICRLAGLSGALVSRIRDDGSIEANYLGYPVSFSSKLPNSTGSLSGKPMIYFGNLKLSSVLVERQSATIMAASYDRYMDTDQVSIRGTRREDIINHSVGDASTYGPVAMLVGS